MATTTTSVNSNVASPSATAKTAAQKAESLFNSIDSGDRGYLLQSDFNTLYVQMALQQENQQRDHSKLTPTSYPAIHPTTFALSGRSQFIADYAGTLAKAANVFGQMDTDHSGQVSHSEFITALTGNAPASDLTPNNPDALVILNQAQSDAQKLLDTYDSTKKGYFTQSDLTAVWTADPSKADPAGAKGTIDKLDLNGDKQVGLDELMATNFTVNIADQMLSLLDPSGQGAIAVSDLAQDTRTDLPFSMEQISAWDSDKNGKITQQELQTGVLQLAQGLISSYDKDNKNYFDLADIKTALAANPQNTESADAVLKQWDVNGDGKVTIHEALAMTIFSLQGLPVSKAPTTPDPATPTPPSDQIKAAQTTLMTASATADQMMGIFDPTGKGLIELSDIANAFIKTPSLGDVERAVDTLNAWDVNGDGHVTRDELVVTQSAHEVTKQIMTLLDPQSSGSISLAALDAHNTAALPYDLATLKTWDTSGDGTLNPDEISAGIVKDAKSIMAQYDSTSKGYFDRSDIQTVLDAHPDSNSGLTAQGVVDYWDTNGDGKVQLADIVSGMSGYITVHLDAPVTASTVYQDALAKAEATLNQFDSAKKGFITQADVAAVYQANQALGNPEDAASTIAAWDQNGDGQVSLPELTSGIELSGLANQFMQQLDPTNQGYISVESLAGLTISMPSIPDAATVIAGWDSDQNGKIGEDEIVAGLKQQAQTYLDHFDQSKQGAFSLSDVEAVYAATPPADSTLTPATVMSQWDANQDQKVDLADLFAGIAAGVSAKAFLTSVSAS